MEQDLNDQLRQYCDKLEAAEVLYCSSVRTAVCMCECSACRVYVCVSVSVCACMHVCVPVWSSFTVAATYVTVAQKVRV